MKNLQLFTFEELSQNAKQRALNDYDYNDYHFDYIYNDAGKTLKEFKGAFILNNDQSNLVGFRLAKCIYNHFYHILFKPAFFKSLNNDKPINHKRIKTNHHKNGKISNFYYSAIKKDNCCVLTGVCYDDDILEPIYDFLKKPYDIDFNQLIKYCIDKLNDSIQNEIDYNYTDEAKTDHLISNEYYFTIEGKMIQD
jgi:hypothetical protein